MLDYLPSQGIVLASLSHYMFGVLGLEKFLDKIRAWPAVCKRLIYLEDPFGKYYPEHVSNAKGILKALPEDLRIEAIY